MAVVWLFFWDLDSPDEFRVNMKKESEVSFADMLAEAMEVKSSMEGKVILGTIVDIKSDKVTVDVGLKAEGRLQLSDVIALKGTDEISIGDTIEVFVEKFEDRNGEPILSIERAKKEAHWQNLENHLANGEPIEGVITGRAKGGFVVDIDGTSAFLPGSQVDLRIVKDITPLLGIKQPFKILKMDKARNNIVVSRRAVLETARDEKKAEVLARLEEGMVITGIVKNITDYGVFVDIGGIDGLLHVTDMSWKRVASPASLVKVGDSVDVQIIKFNRETGRVSLGMKQLVKTPWENIEEKFLIGGKYQGVVVNITEYGVFVELGDGIEGMIYMTELSWVKKNVIPSKVVSVGDQVDVMVLDVNQQKRKISLGLKQCQENPWKTFAEQHPVGTKLEGVVKNITEFGIFVGVTDLLDGMVHSSDVSWEPGSQDEKLRNYTKGQVIEVVVLDVNPVKERISLGIKQLTKDEIGEAVEQLKRGDKVVAVVKAIRDAGVEVALGNGLNGFIKSSELSLDRLNRRPDSVASGENVEAMVLGIDRNTRSVNLSIKSLEIQREKEALQQFGNADSGASLGDILGEALKQNEADETDEVGG
ncbi:MAG: 30S ribosomal protein S1 [Holosporales bacterium]|jgi:small subunit ribosomal protein S1|nr:30S ribosomal protein S1 [Holosporales bacterium]